MSKQSEIERLYRLGYGIKQISKRVHCSNRLTAGHLASIGLKDETRKGFGETGMREEPLALRELRKEQISSGDRLILAEYIREQRAAERPEKLWMSIWIKERDRAKNNARALERSRRPYERLIGALRLRIRKLITRNFRTGRAPELVGCDRVTFMLHIQNQWKRGMNWNNYGKVWTIDHILPCASFDLTTEGGQRKCFHFSNLRPLWKRENIIKSDSIISCQPELILDLRSNLLRRESKK